MIKKGSIEVRAIRNARIEIFRSLPWFIDPFLLQFIYTIHCSFYLKQAASSSSVSPSSSSSYCSYAVSTVLLLLLPVLSLFFVHLVRHIPLKNLNGCRTHCVHSYVNEARYTPIALYNTL